MNRDRLAGWLVFIVLWGLGLAYLAALVFVARLFFGDC